MRLPCYGQNKTGGSDLGNIRSEDAGLTVGSEACEKARDEGDVAEAGESRAADSVHSREGGRVHLYGNAFERERVADSQSSRRVQAGHVAIGSNIELEGRKANGAAVINRVAQAGYHDKRLQPRNSRGEKRKPQDTSLYNYQDR